MPDIPLDDGGGEQTASLKLREADLDQAPHRLRDAADKAKPPAAPPARALQLHPAPRPKDVDEKLLKPEPGEVVSRTITS